MLDEVIDGLHIEKGKRYIDATLGAGGHSVEIVKRGGRLLGIDQDPEAIRYTTENFKFQTRLPDGQVPNAKWGEDITIIQGNFGDIERIARENGFEEVDGVLFDLGVSSHQLDKEERGFSYRHDKSPLDLRMNQEVGEPAWSLITKLSEEELYEIFTRLGEEKRARTIAHALVCTRSMKPIHTTGDFMGIIQELVGKTQELRATSSRIFQALRIWVNDELVCLKNGLEGARHVLVPGGRIAVLSYHSLEDRIVKQFFKGDSWRVITKKPIYATHNEILENRRSRSAKLRVAMKV